MDRNVAILAGTGAAVAAVAAVALAARREGLSPLRPINASSHIVWGEEAGKTSDLDARHTALGLAINVGAGFFWGSVMASLRSRRSDRSEANIMSDAATVGLLASVVDYGIVPRRLSPGWENAVSPASVAFGMASMAAGLAAGTWVAERQTREAGQTRFDNEARLAPTARSVRG
jgi:hypothetical protein